MTAVHVPVMSLTRHTEFLTDDIILMAKCDERRRTLIPHSIDPDPVGSYDGSTIRSDERGLLDLMDLMVR